MFLGEIDYWAALGLEAPQGETGTDSADPSEQPEGATDPEIADPDEDGESIQQEDAEDGGEQEDETPEPEQKLEQSKSERARQAAARRKREQDAAIQAAVEAALSRERAENERRTRELLKGLNLKDPETGAAIESMDQYQSWQSQQALKNAESELKRGKLTAQTLQQVVSQMPELQKMRDALQRAEAERQTAESQRVQQQIQAELSEISKLDPTVTTLDSLLRSEKGQQIYDLTKRGLDLVSAYKVANLDKLTQRAASAAKAQKAASDQGRQHLRQTSSRGQGSVEVPADIAEMYKSLTPGISDAEMRQKYAAYLKRIK